MYHVLIPDDASTHSKHTSIRTKYKEPLPVINCKRLPTIRQKMKNAIVWCIVIRKYRPIFMLLVCSSASWKGVRFAWRQLKFKTAKMSWPKCCGYLLVEAKSRYDILDLKPNEWCKKDQFLEHVGSVGCSLNNDDGLRKLKLIELQTEIRSFPSIILCRWHGRLPERAKSVLLGTILDWCTGPGLSSH